MADVAARDGISCVHRSKPITGHRAGEKTFIDFSGDGLDVVNAFPGECQKAVLFVAVLGASNLACVEPVLHQDLPTWIGCHVRAFEYFGGVTPIWVPDNLEIRTSVPSPCHQSAATRRKPRGYRGV